MCWQSVLGGSTSAGTTVPLDRVEHQEGYFCEVSTNFNTGHRVIDTVGDKTEYMLVHCTPPGQMRPPVPAPDQAYKGSSSYSHCFESFRRSSELARCRSRLHKFKNSQEFSSHVLLYAACSKNRPVHAVQRNTLATTARVYKTACILHK